MIDAALEGFGDTAVSPPVGHALGGIDPGKKGAAAVVLPDGKIRVWRTPTLDGKLYDLKGVKRVAQEMRALGVKLVMVERQQASYLRKGPGMEKRANQQVRNSFQVGYGYAMWQMALVMAGVPHEVVMPAVWKKRMGILVPSNFGDEDARSKEAKVRSIALCQRTHPEHDLRWNPDHHSSKPSDGMAEAILLADYGARHVL